MNRTEFIVATALILLAAFATGWFAYWLLHHFTRVTRADMEELDSMASALHDAEEARDAALAHLEAREREMTHETELREAELATAMQGLREARAENDEMRDYIARLQARAGQH